MTAKRALFSALGKIGLIAVIAAAFVFAMVGTIYLSLRSPEVRVPEVVNKKRWDAEDALDAAGLHMRVRASRYVNKVEPDVVLNQSPQPGEAVKAGQTIAVVVSRAPGKDDVVSAADEQADGAANAPQNSNAQNQNARNQNNAERANRRGNSNANVGRNSNARNSNAANANRNANRNAAARNADVSANNNRNTANGNRRPTPAVTPAATRPAARPNTPTLTNRP